MVIIKNKAFCPRTKTVKAFYLCYNKFGLVELYGISTIVDLIKAKSYVSV